MLVTFPSDSRKRIHKERKTGEVLFIYKTYKKYKTFIWLETIMNKFERLSHNFRENKKDVGMSDK